MTKENIIGLVLIAAILIGYSYWMTPSAEERLLERQMQDSIAAVQQSERNAREAEAAMMQAQQQTSDSLADISQEIAGLDPSAADSLIRNISKERLGFFSNAGWGEETFTTLENDVIIMKISAKGGHVHSVILKDYKTFEKEPLILFEEEVFAFNFFSGNRQITTQQLFFKPSAADQRFDGQMHIKVSEQDAVTLAMRAYSDLHTEASPSYIEFVYTLSGNDYMIGFHVNYVGMREAIASNTTFLNLDWQARMPRQEKNRTNEQNNSTVYYKYVNDEVSKLRETKDDSDRLLSSLQWISFKQQFFSSTLIAEKGFLNADISSRFADEEDEGFTKQMAASINMAYDARQDNSYAMRMYFGPNRYRTLRAFDLDLERQIPLGWGFFVMSWINRFAVIPVFNFLDGFNLNYGIIILILTILLKIFLTPIAYKTHISQAKMRVLKPEIDELGKKFPKKEDAMKKQQATMALYKKAGVNPMAGCVPMLLQLPILLALFRFFPASIELRQEGFLWADDLSSYDSILDLPFTIPFYGDHVSLFTILMTISTIIYTRMNNQMMASSNQMPGMKTMMYFMPVMLMGIFNNFASGLSYYYFLTNIITFGQMYLFRKFVDEKALRQKIEENKKKPVTKSKWAARMEALAKQQQEVQKRKR